MILTKSKILKFVCGVFGLLIAATSSIFAQNVIINSVSINSVSGCPPKLSVKINAGSAGSVKYQIEYKSTGSAGFTNGTNGMINPVTAGENDYTLDLAWEGSSCFNGTIKVTITGANTASSEALVAVDCGCRRPRSGDLPPDPGPTVAIIAASQAIQFGAILLSVTLAILVIGALIFAFWFASVMRQSLLRDLKQNPARDAQQHDLER